MGAMEARGVMGAMGAMGARGVMGAMGAREARGSMEVRGAMGARGVTGATEAREEREREAWGDSGDRKSSPPLGPSLSRKQQYDGYKKVVTIATLLEAWPGTST